MVVQKRKCFAGMGGFSFEIGYACGTRKAAAGRGSRVFSSEAKGGQKFGLKGVAFH